MLRFSTYKCYSKQQELIRHLQNMHLIENMAFFLENFTTQQQQKLNYWTEMLDMKIQDNLVGQDFLER